MHERRGLTSSETFSTLYIPNHCMSNASREMSTTNITTSHRSAHALFKLPRVVPQNFSSFMVERIIWIRILQKHEKYHWRPLKPHSLLKETQSTSTCITHATCQCMYEALRCQYCKLEPLHDITTGSWHYVGHIWYSSKFHASWEYLYAGHTKQTLTNTACRLD